MNIRRFLVFLTLILGAVTLHAAEPSLLRKEEARLLKPEEAVMFGPQAGKYRYDSRMIRASMIAQSRAHRRSTNFCWRYVKTALLEAGAVDSYPKSTFAKQAAQELPQSFGFKRIRCSDPFRAPIGSVLVYGGPDAGHVEIRTATGYASDFVSRTPYLKRPLLGIYVKPG